MAVKLNQDYVDKLIEYHENIDDERKFILAIDILNYIAQTFNENKGDMTKFAQALSNKAYKQYFMQSTGSHPTDIEFLLEWQNSVFATCRDAFHLSKEEIEDNYPLNIFEQVQKENNIPNDVSVKDFNDLFKDMLGQLVMEYMEN